MPKESSHVLIFNQEIVACGRCPRLVRYREKVAREKRRAYREWTYWGKPVPGFGDAHAQVLILGLAPAAHGANRTGRMFTGDRSAISCIPPCSKQASPNTQLPCTSTTDCNCTY